MSLRFLLIAAMFWSGCGSTSDSSETSQSTPSPITESEYLRSFRDLYCQVLDRCSSGEITCDDEDSQVDSSEEHGCDFNPDAAEDCLSDEWTCTEATEFFPSFPLPPASCDDVYTNCPSDTDSETSENR